jgi:hypothetical protein
MVASAALRNTTFRGVMPPPAPKNKNKNDAHLQGRVTLKNAF